MGRPPADVDDAGPESVGCMNRAPPALPRFMHCLVVDDDPLAREVLEHYVERHAGLSLAASVGDAVEAANVLRTADVDLVLLDVELPEMSGLEWLRSLAHRPSVILVSSKEDYALDAFDVEVADYLLKPVTYARFLKAVARAERWRASSTPPPASRPADHVFIKRDGRLVKVDLAAIGWIEAQGDYVLIHAGEDRHLVHTTMKALEARLPAADFARVHRSFIVRIDRISDIEDTMIVIDREVIPIGASYREALLRRLNTL